MNLTSKLTSKIMIQKRTNSQDEFGGYVENWVDYQEVFAKIEFQNFHQYVIAQKSVNEKNLKITIRNIKINHIDYRILIEDEPYKIKFIDSSNKYFIDILCSCIV